MNEELTIMDAFKSIPPEIWCGTFAGVAVFAFEVFLVAKGIIFTGRNKRVEKARAAGRCIRGKQVKCRYRDSKSDHKTCNRRYVAQYEYTLNGKTGTKQVTSTGCKPGYTIWLYYDERGRVFTNDPPITDLLMIVLYIIPVLAAGLVFHLLGYDVREFVH